MLRTIFFSMGLATLLWGLPLFFVDKMTLNQRGESASERPGVIQTVSARNGDGILEVNPPVWLAYTLVTAGSLTMLYSVALPRR
ncbi:hypothetical protein Mal4_33810 [Maioricimonas rarisocia]|uniref:Uncharacterized protein n=1 Tax=Maioricimonas rarisocia TaxID=2528026 RepID=A0A517Z9A3_9PLAN|nr:hypothetical protein [Maioricimonas rarisocia]QDU39046.1 hypothetical protein Mal4_33810 [Maioricimonas rarisocia]